MSYLVLLHVITRLSIPSAILFFEAILRRAVMGEWQYEKRKRNARLSEAVF
jgi:hypothetical protein